MDDLSPFHCCPIKCRYTRNSGITLCSSAGRKHWILSLWMCSGPISLLLDQLHYRTDIGVWRRAVYKTSFNTQANWKTPNETHRRAYHRTYHWL